MRELGFRAFIKPLGRYATGLDTIQFHKCCDVAGAGIWTVVTVNEGIFEGDDIIVEQDTGLKDKNGKEICVGDIVQCGAYKGKVHYSVGVACYCVGDYTPIYQISRIENESFITLKVIGNIHENGDILNDEQN